MPPSASPLNAAHALPRACLGFEQGRREWIWIAGKAVYETATRQAAAFGERYGVEPPVQRPGPLPGPTFIFDAKLLEARVLGAETGEVVAEPELAVPAAPPADLLSLDWEAPAEWNILGIPDHVFQPALIRWVRKTVAGAG